MTADKGEKGNKASSGHDGHSASYAATDLHDKVPIGGMRLGQPFVFVSEQAMPHLTVEQIIQACDALVQGRDTYRSLLQLHRLRPLDIPLVWQATASQELRIRWERLWVLAPFLNRLIRAGESQEVLMDLFRQDLTAVHLLSRFLEQNNHAVRRIFARLKEPLRLWLCAQAVDVWNKDSAAFQQISAILGAFETDEEALRQGLEQARCKPEQIERILQRLYIRYKLRQEGKSLSEILRDKLQSWRR